MKASRKSEILIVKILVIGSTIERVIVARSFALIPNVPYVVVSQV